MTIAILKQLLQELSNEVTDDFQVWLSSDEEGNSFLPMFESPQLCLAIDPRIKTDCPVFSRWILFPGESKTIYIRLFHGRTNANQDMNEWGLDGPIFGPYEFVHTTYALNLKLSKNGLCSEFFCYEDMVYYDGVYYGDWSVFGLETLEKRKYKPAVFEQKKEDLPT